MESTAARASAPPAVVVVNPIKTDSLPELTQSIDAAAHAAGLPTPRYLQTTEEDPGTGQAREAVESGASVVIAAGGDGTVRAVATALAGTGVPMGIVPLGTGNLLARNLDLPLADVRECARIALTAPDVPLDLGWLTLHDDDGASPSVRGTAAPEAGADPGEGDGREGSAAVGNEGEERFAGEDPRGHGFLVIAGIGFDADMVGGADVEMKRRLGWMAYFYAALAKLFSRRMTVEVEVDGRRRRESFRSRTVMVANTGMLPGGILLAPDAAPDDGWLDILTLDTRAGLVGWTSLGVKVLAQRLGIRGRSDAMSTIATKRGREFEVWTSRPEPIQVDGELLGRARGFKARVDAGALRVRRG